MSQLFYIEPTPVKRTYKLTTYKGNRIALKLMRILKKGKIYSIKRLQSAKDLVIFEVSIVSTNEALEDNVLLIREIVSYIPDTFPSNYLFDFKSQPLGFVHSFNIKGEYMDVNVSHKIKEINKNSVLTEKQINI